MLRRMDVSDVRRRLRAVIEDARRRASERRALLDEATRAYEAFLPEVAVPAFHAVAQALVGEGLRFKVFTPGDAVRLTPEYSQEDFIEVALDATGDTPSLVLTSSRGRGRRRVVVETPVFEGRAIPEIFQDDVIEAVFEALPPLLAR